LSGGAEYLEKIKKFREEERSIYYLDETWYDTHDTAKKGWTDSSNKCVLKDVPPNRGSRMIIIHCGSKEGWVKDGLKLCGKKIEECNVDYHKNMQADIFETWFEKTLIPNLKENSVIVMDNASYHSRLSEKIPNTSSHKLEIETFLLKHDLYFHESYTKKQLLEVVNTKSWEKQYVVDNIAKKYGHTVLRLPPYYCIFNPIELIWGQLKRRIRRKNKYPKFDKKL
jgi:transposase